MSDETARADTPEDEPEIYRDPGGAWSVAYDDSANHYTVTPPARPQRAPEPEGEGKRDGKGRFRRKARTSTTDTAAEPTGETAQAANVDDDNADDGWMPPGANVTTTPADEASAEAVPGDGGKKDGEEKRDEDSPLLMVGGFLVLATVGGGIILVNTVSGALLAVGGAGVVVATGLGVAGFRAVKNRIKNGPRHRNHGTHPWSLLPFQSRTARRAQRKAAKRAAKNAGLGLGLPAASGGGRAAGTGRRTAAGRKAASGAARSNGLPKSTSSRTPKGPGVPKSKGGAGLGLPNSRGKALGLTGGPGRRARSGAGVAKLTGPGHTTRGKSTAAKNGGKTSTGPKGKSGKQSTTPQANLTTNPKGRITHTKAARKANAHVASMPLTSPMLRRRMNRMSPTTRAELRNDLNRTDNLRPGRRRKLERHLDRADQRHEQRQASPTKGQRFDETVAVGLYGAFKLGQALYRVARGSWTYATPQREFTEAHAREFWRNAKQEFTAGQQRDTKTAGEWDAERERQAEQARQRQQERTEQAAREREARRRQRADERRRAQERRAAGERPPIRVKVKVGEPIRDQRGPARPHPSGTRPSVTVKPADRPRPHVAGPRTVAAVKPAERVRPPKRAAIEGVDAFDDGARDTDPPTTRPITVGKPISIKPISIKPISIRPADPVRPPRLTARPKEKIMAVATDRRTWRDTGYQPHPSHQAMIQAHGLMFSCLPPTPKDMRDHLVGLAILYVECGQHVSFAGKKLPDEYPVEREMHSFYEEYAKAYRHLGDATLQVAAAYAAANEKDVNRSENPRPNEAWNNVPEGGEQGIDMTPIREQFRQAHLNAWSYRFTDPLDLRAWLGGLYATNHVLAEQIDPNMRFPGAGGVLFEHWHNLGTTWEAIGNHSFTIVEAYEFTAADVLERHRNPRVNEHLTNVRR